MSKYFIFSQLNKNAQIEMCVIPQCVSVTKNPDIETRDQIILRQEKFLLLPERIQNILASQETGEKIQQIGQAFNLQLLQMADISRAIRNYYFGELKIEDMPFDLAKEIPIDLSKAQEITKIILEKIINDDSQEKAQQANLEKLTLSIALKSYPEIGEQAITAEKITILNFPEPARPSIKNWLADYTAVLYNTQRDSIARNNYLFHQKNTERLNSDDRQRLSYVLKAFDENSLVTIDRNTKKLLFPESRPSVNNAKAQPFALGQTPSRLSLENSPASKISFSSPQKLPYEKLTAPTQPVTPQPNRITNQPYRITPIGSRQNVVDTKAAPKVMPKNVVNLRDN